MNITKFSKRERILGMITIGCLMLVGLGESGWDAIHHRLDAMDQEAAALNDHIHHSEILLSRQSRAEKKFQEALNVLGEKVDDQNLMTQILAGINTLAQSKNIQLQELNSLPLENESGSRILKIK